MKYVIDSKTYEKHIRDEVHLYGLLHQLAFLAGKVKDEEDMANLVETSKHYGEIAEKNGRLTTTGAKRTGCMFCMFGVHLEKPPNRFQRMALTHPKQYEFCIHKLGCGKVLDFLGVPYAPNGGESP